MRSEITDLFLDYSARKLREMTKSVNACCGQLDDEQMWQRGAEYENSIANLLLHLCGNMRQWIMHGIKGDPDVRVRDAEFAARGGLTKSELIERFRGAVEEAIAVIAGLTDERLLERTDPQQFGEESILEVIYRVVGHVQQHTGQIILLTKQMSGRDLDLTIPRPR